MASTIAYTPRVSTITCAALPSSQQAQINGGPSYQLILEHVLSYSGTYEIPLQTMYTINSTRGDAVKTPDAQQQQKPKHQHQRSCSSAESRVRPISPSPSAFDSRSEAAAQFTSSLIYHVAKLPSQPCSLSPTYLTAYLYRCFPRELNLVDFPQSLTALDYLKDLEMRRRRELVAALRRLGVDRDVLSENVEEVSRNYPGLATWVRGIESSERKVSALYTQLYVALRRWVLINELNLEPFNKYNCLAMLNTLYPPTAIASSPQPTPALTPEVLKRQRDGFFKYIQSVEKHGAAVLEPLMQQGKKKDTDTNGWPTVYQTLASYLRVANSLIDECASIANASNIENARDPLNIGWRRGKKVDSGVSFGSSATSSFGGRSSNISSKGEHLKALPSPPLPPSTSTPPNPFDNKGLSTLEKIAKEIRKIKALRRSDGNQPLKRPSSPEEARHRPESSDSMMDSHEADNPLRTRSIKKFRSLTDLRKRNRSSSLVAEKQGLLPADAPAFDKAEMQRQRLLWEANEARRNAGKS